MMDKDKASSQIYLGHKPPGCKTKKKKKIANIVLLQDNFGV
jgi:hypothetical protein